MSTRVVNVLQDVTINEVEYKAGDTIDLVATGQVEDYYTDYAWIIPRANKMVELVMPNNFPVLSLFISPKQNMLEFDYTLLDSVSKESPHYSRGKKIRSEYYVGQKLAATKDFIDVMHENEDRIASLNVHFKWYDHEGNMSFDKIQEVKKYNKFEAETEERQRRERQIDFLKGAAKGTPQEPYINMLFDYYRESVNKYTTEGNLEWSNKVDADLATDLATLPAEMQQIVGGIQQILNADTPRVDDPTRTMKVYEALKYQMGTFELND